MIGARNSCQIDESYTRRRHQNLDVCYISESYFGFPRQSIRNNSDSLILFKQTLRDVQSMYKDVGGYGMRYDEIEEICRELWSEKKTKYVLMKLFLKMRVKIVFSMKAKTHRMKAFVKVKLFD